MALEPLKVALPDELDERTRGFYIDAMETLERKGVEYLVGGAYAMAYHANIVRHTKDFDVFVRARDARRALEALAEAGYRTELTFPHWLGKAFESDAFVDVIFGSGNGLTPVDDGWFEHAIDGESLGRKTRVVPAEEVIWSKSFIMERERFDGADVNHLLLARAKTLDWERLIRRFAGHERVLLAQLMLFGYAYPGESASVPAAVIDRLMDMVKREAKTTERVTRGTFLSRQQYLIDIDERGYEDARVKPRGPLTREDVNHWTAAIGKIH